MTVDDLQWRPLEPWWRSLLQHQSNNNGQMRCDTCDCAIEVVKIYFLPNSRPHSTAAYLVNLGLPTILQAFFPKFNLSMIQYGFSNQLQKSRLGPIETTVDVNVLNIATIVNCNRQWVATCCSNEGLARSLFLTKEGGSVAQAVTRPRWRLYAAGGRQADKQGAG